MLLGGSEGALVTNLIVAENFITASVALNVGGQYFINDVLYSIENNTPKKKKLLTQRKVLNNLQKR
ncbi:hypothetical protein J4727_18840 [Providencia rettgeri]|uniref:Uncharacterized protein n=1 Tax=Providencia rettgeri TaxID=587 RepID=A0A939NGC7_PRORE|nr:hypothetical protein [Providencia rettgeri]